VGERLKRSVSPFSSVRLRMTALYVVVLICSSLLLGLTVDRLVSRSLMKEFDSALSETLTALTRVLDGAYLEAGSPSEDGLRGEIEEVGIPSETALLLLVPGKPVLSLGWQGSPPSPDDGRLSGSSIQAGPTTVRFGGRSWRVLVAQRRVAAGPGYRLILFRDLDRVESQLQTMRRSMLLALLPLILISAIAGYLLAGRVLSPVDRIADRARQVQVTGLEARLEVENPGDEFGRLTTVLNDLLARLEKAFEQQKQFLADAAHELRTPVAAVRAQADVTLLRVRTTGEYEAAIRSILGQTEYLSKIVDDLLFMARADASQVPLRKEPLDLMEVVDDTCRSLFPVAQKKGVVLDWEFGGEIGAMADAHLVRRAVSNLVTNAVRHTPRDGIVSVRVAASEKGASIEVSDSGIGIADEAIPHLFDRFFRGEHYPGEIGDEGIGLGLAIVKAIMNLHHGAATARNSPRGGSIFSLEFPG